MISPTVRRLGTTLLVLPIALAVIFFLLRVTGNPIETAFGDRITESELERRVELAGFNLPWHEQYLRYLWGIASGNLGVSFSNIPVTEMIRDAITATLEVTVLGLVFLGISIYFFGSLAAWKVGTKTDWAISASSIVTFALPGFLSAVAVREFSRYAFPDFDASGRLSLGNLVQWQTSYRKTGLITLDAVLAGNWSLFFDAVAHLLLPAVALVFIGGTLVRVLRDSLVREMNNEYIQSALFRGIPRRRVFYHHALRPALPPVLATFGVTAGGLITGVVFIERVFEIRGLGYLLVDAVLERDFMLVQGIFIVTYLVVAFVNAIVDGVIISIDKRQGRQLS